MIFSNRCRLKTSIFRRYSELNVIVYRNDAVDLCLFFTSTINKIYPLFALELKKIIIKKIIIKKKERLSFTYRYATRDIVKNYDLEEGVNLISERLMSGFNFAVLFTLNL